MAFFTAIGTISNDIVRRETKDGVVATFRLETGAPRGRKLWIDIECWGHLAGTISRHGETGRRALVIGRICERTWRDLSTGGRRCRLLVSAHDVELLDSNFGPTTRHPVNSVVTSGVVLDAQPEVRETSGSRITFQLRTTERSGRLRLAASLWLPSNREQLVRPRLAVAFVGSFRYDGRDRRLVLEGGPNSITVLDP